jgi:putative acetyltransferase
VAVLTTTTIRPFRDGDQNAVKVLILAGLAEHLGVLDPEMNPDLNDIQTAYIENGALVLGAEIEAEVVGVGMLIEESCSAGRLVRMSVNRHHRGRGIGRSLVNRLVGEARSRGYQMVVCETNHDWSDAVSLYHACGFEETAVVNGERHFTLRLR